MPTEAVTGTSQVTKRAAKSDDKSTRTVVHKPDEREKHFVGEPLADHSGNGTIQATAPDGSTTNIDAAEDGWQDKVRAIDPKHHVLRYED